ncbi:MAG: helix-turn-helix domain-containing protein [Bacilli bacterium]|nr:helix-turn-helix domain-containing protein [Bacilli bacterium]
MDSIGRMLRETRESSGVSIEEASNDLTIKNEFLLNIEEGKIGCFKDIFELKEYIASYAKYLGLDSENVLDEFNEYLFEYTSKIPVKEIEKIAKKEAKEETNKISSPYTRRPRKYSRNYYIAIYLVILALVALAILWSVKQITIDNHITNEISRVSF